MERKMNGEGVEKFLKDHFDQSDKQTERIERKLLGKKELIRNNDDEDQPYCAQCDLGGDACPRHSNRKDRVS